MRFARLFSCAIAAAIAITAATAASAQEKKVIRINHAGADDITGTEHQMFAWIFANYVNSKAPTLDVKLFPNSGLGQSRQVIEAMQLGSGASMHIGGMAEFANFCKAKCGVIGLPFIFKGYDHVQRVLDGPVGAELSKEMEAVGFKVIGYLYSWGYRNVVTAKKEVKTVADLKGLKIRTIPTPVFVGAVNAMGASATPMNFGEVYTSMQSGVLDGYRAHGDDDGVVQVLRDRQILRADPASHRSDRRRFLAVGVEQARRQGTGGRAGRRQARHRHRPRHVAGARRRRHGRAAEARHDHHASGHDRGAQGRRERSEGIGGEAQGRGPAEADPGAISVNVAIRRDAPAGSLSHIQDTRARRGTRIAAPAGSDVATERT